MPFALICLVQAANAQTRVKTWIFLTDKLDAAGEATVANAGYVSARALERRAMRGAREKTAQLVWQDAPVSALYEEAVMAAGITIVQRSRWLNAVTAWLDEDELILVRSMPFVRETRPVAYLSANREWMLPRSAVIVPRSSPACGAGGGIYGPSCQQLDIINAIPPLERGINGAGVIIGFLDILFGENEPFDHPSLEHIRSEQRLAEWRDFANRDPDHPCTEQTSRHGMNVASVGVGYMEGQIVGPGHGATVYAATTDCTGLGYEQSVGEDNFVAATEWMVSEGADVLSSSLGYDDVQGIRYTTDDLDGDTGLTTIVFDWAAARGVVPVTAAGNSGKASTWSLIGMPADGDSVIAVGGARPDRSFWEYSSRGPTADGRIKPDVAALSDSVFIASESGSYEFSGGTSFAAPMVGGVVTQMLQVNPHLNPVEVRELLRSTASQAMSPDNRLGWGIINADAAIKRAVALDREEFLEPVSERTRVHTPYPNPFRRYTRFEIENGRPSSFARLTVFNVIGQEVAVLHAGPLNAGSFLMDFDAASLPPGLYGFLFETERERVTGTMVLVQ